MTKILESGYEPASGEFWVDFPEGRRTYPSRLAMTRAVDEWAERKHELSAEEAGG